MPKAKKPKTAVKHKKLDELFSKIEKDEREVKEIADITFETLKLQNKKKK